MIGVFDSGAGGLFALAELRRLLPKADILCLTDRKNAPYGTKSEDELTRHVTSGVDTLLSLGCSSVLMACCTASTVWERLPERERAAAVPIIEPVTEAALRVSKNKKIKTKKATLYKVAFNLQKKMLCVINRNETPWRFRSSRLRPSTPTAPEKTLLSAASFRI